MLNQLQEVIGLEGAFNFATIGAPSFETSVRANSLNQMAPPTTSLAMNGQKHINLATGSAETDGVNLSQLKDQWHFDPFPWTFVSATTFIAANPNAVFVFLKGTKVTWMESGTQKYGVVSGISGSTVTLVATTDYAMTVSPDGGTNAISYGYPVGFPASFNFTMSWTGFSSNPLTASAKWTINNGFCDIIFIAFSAGTANASSITCVAPISGSVGAVNFCPGEDNGTVINAIAIMTTGTTVHFYDGVYNGAWTGSGPTQIQGFQLRYLI